VLLGTAIASWQQWWPRVSHAVEDFRK